jgi:hypothetical protein
VAGTLTASSGGGEHSVGKMQSLQAPVAKWSIRVGAGKAVRNLTLLTHTAAPAVASGWAADGRLASVRGDRPRLRPLRLPADTPFLEAHPRVQLAAGGGHTVEIAMAVVRTAAATLGSRRKLRYRRTVLRRV